MANNILKTLEELDPSAVNILSDEQIIDLYTQTGQYVKDIVEPALDALKTEMLARLQQENVKAKIVNQFSVTEAERIAFNVSVEEAEILNAVKKVVDQTVLKKLWQSGAKLEPTITKYLMVRALKKPEDI
jgi:hypothetical protein